MAAFEVSAFSDVRVCRELAEKYFDMKEGAKKYMGIYEKL